MFKDWFGWQSAFIGPVVSPDRLGSGRQPVSVDDGNIIGQGVSFKGCGQEVRDSAVPTARAVYRDSHGFDYWDQQGTYGGGILKPLSRHTAQKLYTEIGRRLSCAKIASIRQFCIRPDGRHELIVPGHS